MASEGTQKTGILVVDDDPQMLRYVRDALAEAGYAVVVTGDPEEVPRLVRMHKPALVVLDLLLPQDQEVIESQRPQMVPVDLTEELHIKVADAGAIAYRRLLKEELGVEYV